MKVTECAHPSRYFSASVSAKLKLPTFFLFWLPAADIGGTQYSVSSIVYKARYKDKSLILSDIRIPWNVS